MLVHSSYRIHRGTVPASSWVCTDNNVTVICFEFVLARASATRDAQLNQTNTQCDLDVALFVAQ